MSKTFPGCVALDRLDLEIAPGEVMALVGQNGCGKSTLIKVLSGYHAPDPGADVRFAGEQVVLGDPDVAVRLGIHFVHQDLGLLDALSAAENMAVGTRFATRRGGTIRWREQHRRTSEALHELGYDLDVRAPVGELTASQRVGVAIARALHRDAGHPLNLLVLDEPTAAMPQSEVDTLQRAVRRLRDAGIATLFVSHRLDEVLAVADRITVMRDGRRVAIHESAAMDRWTLIEEILGRTADSVRAGASDVGPSPAPAAEAHLRRAPAISARGLQGRRLRGLDLDLYPGEIVGVTGLTGSGREELAGLLFGAEQHQGGQLLVRGELVGPLTPATAKRLGVAMVPANRRAAAILPDADVRENLTIAGLLRLRRLLLVSRRRERTEADTWLETLDVQPRDQDAPILGLSGGNQQKVLLARWLRIRPRILILDEPTQGVDVGTKPEIYALLRRIAHEGTGVLVCSTDSEELVEVADRVVVLGAGVAKAELRGSTLNLDRLNHEVVAA